MRTSISLLLAGAAAVAAAGCGQNDGSGTANAATSANLAAASHKKVPYCFYKDENTKGWTASAGEDGNVTVKGRAYVADGRYMPALKPPEISGTTASLQLGMPQNDTGYSSPSDWWDVKKVIPDSGAITEVRVLCGAKTLASLTVKR